MFEEGKSFYLDVEQLNFVKEQTGYHLHEMIGRTIILTITTDNPARQRTSTAHKIVGASISRHKENDERDNEIGWWLNLTLESNIVNQWVVGEELRETRIEGLTLYIRRESQYRCRGSLVSYISKSGSTAVTDREETFADRGYKII
jgi:hypothetical protein